MARRLPQSDVSGQEAFLLTSPPVRAAVALLGFAGVGLLAAGFLSPLTASARSMVAAFGVIVAPALLVTPATRRALGGVSTPLLVFALPVAALLVLSVHAMVAEAFLLARVPFSIYAGAVTWLLLVVLPGIFAREVATWRRRGAGQRVLPGAARSLLAVALLVAVAARMQPAYVGTEDEYDHIGYVQRVMALNSMQPDGLLALPTGATETMSPDPRKGSLHPVVAFVAHLSDSAAETTWPSLRVVMFPLAVLAFSAFAAAFVGNGGLLAATLALFFLSYSGTGLRLVNSVCHGANLSSVWYWVLTPVALAAAQRPVTRGRAALLGVLAAGGVFVHFGVALHVAVLAVTLVVFSPWIGVTRARAGRIGGVLLAVAGAAALVRLASSAPQPSNPIHSHLQGVMFVSDRWFVLSPIAILRSYGMIFLGGLLLLPATVVLARREHLARVAVAFCALPVGVVFIPPLATALYHRGGYMVFRALLNAPLLPVVVLTAAGLASRARRGGFLARAVVAGALLIWGTVFVSPALRATAADVRTWFHPAAETPDDADLLRAVDRLPAQSVILSDPLTSYRLSAHTPKRFVAIYQQHANPYDPYALGRLRAVRDALSPFAPSTAAVAACREYGVDFVAVNAAGASEGFLESWRPALYDAAVERLGAMPECFRRIAGGNGFTIFRFDPSGVPKTPWGGTPPPVSPVAPGTPPLDACPVPVPGDLFRITGLGVSPQAVLPGDTVTVTIGYRRDEAGPYTLPVLFHLRFDETGSTAARRWPGEKYLRRFRERRDGGGFVRFRRDASPGHGIEEPDLWPVGIDLRERFAVPVPPTARTGRYRVELRVVPDALVPNFHVDDLLFNRDHYSGTPCATLLVRDRVPGGVP